MKRFTLIGTAALLISAGTAFAQSSGSAQVRVQPGHFCALNKCVRFSNDLNSVSIQGRRALSVASLGLRNDPVISAETYSQIFRRALTQSGVNGNRD